MNIINENDQLKTNNPDIEQVQFQKQEYKLIGTYYMPRGVKLFSYNMLNDEVVEVNIKLSNTVYIMYRDGRVTWEDKDAKKTLADPILTYFTCLNMANAKRRVERFLSGEIKSLFNLKEVRNETIKFY